MQELKPIEAGCLGSQHLILCAQTPPSAGPSLQRNTYLDPNRCEIQLLRELDWERSHGEIKIEEATSSAVHCGATLLLKCFRHGRTSGICAKAPMAERAVVMSE